MTINFCSKSHENPETNLFCQVCGEKLSPQTMNLVAGAVLEGRYRIVQQIGQGGFGRTYLCEDLNRFNEPCVLKEFAPQVHGTNPLDKAKRLFEREANVLYKLQHPQIPKFRELFQMTTAGGGLFLVQDYVAGHTYRYALNARLQKNQTFQEDEVRRLLVNILPVLEYTHSLGVIHRDIAPDNLIMRASDGMPVLIDFGGVKQIAVNAEIQTMGNTEGLTRLGKVGYAPSEQLQRGTVSPHSDLYSLAATCLVLLTGQEPTALLDPQTMNWKWREVIQLSPDLAGAFDRMLKPQPADRFQSATEVLQALQNQQKPSILPTVPVIKPVNPVNPIGTPSSSARTAVVAPLNKPLNSQPSNQPTNQVLASHNQKNAFTPSSETTTDMGTGDWRQLLVRTGIGVAGLLAAIGLAWGVTNEVNKPKSNPGEAVTPTAEPSPSIESPSSTESASPTPFDEGTPSPETTESPSPETTESSEPEKTKSSTPEEPSGSGNRITSPGEESTPRERRSRRRSRVNSEESSPTTPRSRSSNSEGSEQPSRSGSNGQSRRSSEAEKSSEEEQPRRRRRRRAVSEESEPSTPQKSRTTPRQRQSAEPESPNLEGRGNREGRGNKSLDGGSSSPRTTPVRPSKPDRVEPKKQQPERNGVDDGGEDSPTITQPKPDEAPL